MQLSTFAQHYTSALRRFPNISTTTHAKHSLLVSLESPSTPSSVRDTINSLVLLEGTPSDTTSDPEENVLKRVAIEQSVISLYAEALDTYLTEASDVEAEAEWWADIERSLTNIAWYLLQTFPGRLFRSTQAIMHAVRTRRLPFQLSLFKPASFRRLFPSTSALHHNALIVSLFPHLQYQPHISLPSMYQSQNTFSAAINTSFSSISRCMRMLSAFFALPFDLARQECRYKRKELERVRDERAEVLGTLAEMRDSLRDALEDPKERSDDVGVGGSKLGRFMASLEHLAQAEDADVTDADVVVLIQRFANATLQSHRVQHAAFIHKHDLRRPSRLTLLWPRILLLPPLTLYCLRTLNASRASLIEVVKEVVQTVDGFLRGWLLEPLRDVLKTVRAGGEDGVIVRKEGIAADLDSLERMTLALAADALHYGPEQLAALAAQIRLGDLTPVLRIYEEDIKSPLRSALTGTLLRSIFVQVQKAKVDIDQTLAGVDKLLKSQELTFAFVGVAPAFAIVYITGGFLRNLWASGRGRGRYGGRHRRASVWFAMRRIERLLIAQPKSSYDTLVPRLSAAKTIDGIPSLTAGLLLLSLAHLRTYAETILPAHSHLREGFLDDVANLEDPGLGRGEKMRVVDRMWKSWGGVLGWGSIPGEMMGR